MTNFTIQAIKVYIMVKQLMILQKRKGLRCREDILDNMGSEELAANLFRITQTESKLKKIIFLLKKRQTKLIITLEKI